MNQDQFKIDKQVGRKLEKPYSSDIWNLNRYLETIVGYAALAFALLGGILIYQGWLSTGDGSSTQASLGHPIKNYKINKLERINRHFQRTDLNAALIQAKNAQHIHQSSPQIEESTLTVADRAPFPTHLPQNFGRDEDGAGDVIRRLEAEEPTQELSPGDKIEMALVKERWLANYEKDLDRATVREIVAKARLDGYDLTFDTDLNLIEVKNYRPPTKKYFLAE